MPHQNTEANFYNTAAVEEDSVVVSLSPNLTVGPTQGSYRRPQRLSWATSPSLDGVPGCTPRQHVPPTFLLSTRNPHLYLLGIFFTRIFTFSLFLYFSPICRYFLSLFRKILLSIFSVPQNTSLFIFHISSSFFYRPTRKI